MAERVFTRREAAGLAVKGAALASGLAVVEGSRFVGDTRINFVDERDRHRRSKRGVIVFGGYTVRDARPVADAIAPAFEVPVIYTVYAGNRVDVVGAVNNFLHIREDTGMDELTIYGHSEGVQVGGAFAKRLYDEVGDDVRIARAILDGSTRDLSDTNYATAGEIFAHVDNPAYTGGPTVSATLNLIPQILNWIYYGTGVSTSQDLLKRCSI